MLKNSYQNINYNIYFQKSLIYLNKSSSTIKPLKPLKSIITVSPNASSRIITMFSLLDKPYPLGIRISINKKGCNGLNYIMKYIIDNEEGRKIISKDEIINITEGINIFIDPLSAFAIVGTVMDWKENDITSEFSFINPNAKGFCGCGESFNV
jgi:iron-sulfur cluster assembly accessory protein